MLNKNDQQIIRQIVAEELQRTLNSNWALIGDAITGIVEKAVQRALNSSNGDGASAQAGSMGASGGTNGGSRPTRAILTRQPIRLQTRQPWGSGASPSRTRH